MTPERLDRLRFQAAHKGMTPERYALITKEGRNPDAEMHGAMVTITPTELQEFLEAVAAADQR
jgi:hypothetical protein